MGVNIEKTAIKWLEARKLPCTCILCGGDLLSTAGNNDWVYTKRKEWLGFHSTCIRKEINERWQQRISAERGASYTRQKQ